MLVALVAVLAPDPALSAEGAQQVRIEDSEYWCETSPDGNRVLKQKGSSFRKVRKSVVRRLEKRVARRSKKIQKLSRRRLGRPEIEHKIVIQHLRRYPQRRLLNQLRSCADRPELIDDWTDPGMPAEKRPWDEVVESGYQPASDRQGETAQEAFAYGPDDYIVTSTTLHGTSVVVALHRQTVDEADVPFDAEQFATVILRSFHEIWHVHGGYVGDRYVLKIRAPGESESFSLSQGGVVLSADFYTTLEQAHEMVHPWNGKTYSYVPDETENLFQLETWLQEEATEYIATRTEALVVSPVLFEDGLTTFWEWYLERRGGPFDVSYAELAVTASQFDTDGSEARTMMNGRGIPFVYLLDRELRSRGTSIDELLRTLYENFGLAESPYTQNDLRQTVDVLGNAPVSDLVQRYIETNAPLTEVLDGDFPLLTPPDGLND